MSNNNIDIISKLVGGRDNLDEIWQQVQDNSKRQRECTYHEFELIDNKFGSKYRCANCGCTEEIRFVIAYRQGLEHGRSGK